MEFVDNGVVCLSFFLAGFAVGILAGVIGIALTGSIKSVWPPCRIEDLDDPPPTSDWKDRKGHAD